MYDINVIFSRHEEIGNCDTEGLYKIIEEIKPYVIFEELDCVHFNEAYKEQKFLTPETKAIIMYLQNNTIKHIPVDTYETPEINGEKIAYYENFILENDSEYKELIYKRNMFAARDGFSFLSSKQFLEFTEKTKTQEEIFYQNTDNEEYKKIYKEYKEWYKNREYEMIKNIYDYSKENRYSKAIFLIGADHINSIIEKIQGYKEGDIKINWRFNIKDLGNANYNAVIRKWW